jgi:hypothetical protein
MYDYYLRTLRRVHDESVGVEPMHSKIKKVFNSTFAECHGKGAASDKIYSDWVSRNRKSELSTFF